MINNAIIADIENMDVGKVLQEVFEQLDIMPLIKQSRELFVHVPLGATLFNEGTPIGGTYLDVDLAEAIIVASEGKPVTFYEAPATAHGNIKHLFEIMGYARLVEKYSQVRLVSLAGENDIKTRKLAVDYGFDYPPLEFPEFLFDKENLIISFSNPKAPFSEKVAGFKGLPFSLSGKALVMGSALFRKKNLIHLAFHDIGLGLKDFVIEGLDQIRKAGVTCIGINGGRFAGGLIDQVNVHPVDWNVLVFSRSIGIADAVTASLMGFDPLEMPYFASLAEKGLIPSDLSAVSVAEIGNGRSRLEEQLKVRNDFLPQGSPISTRQWIFGLLGQVSVKDRIKMAGKMVPSVIKYKFSKKRKSNK